MQFEAERKPRTLPLENQPTRNARRGEWHTPAYPSPECELDDEEDGEVLALKGRSDLVHGRGRARRQIFLLLVPRPRKWRWLPPEGEVNVELEVVYNEGGLSRAEAQIERFATFALRGRLDETRKVGKNMGDVGGLANVGDGGVCVCGIRDDWVVVDNADVHAGAGAGGVGITGVDEGDGDGDWLEDVGLHEPLKLGISLDVLIRDYQSSQRNRQKLQEWIWKKRRTGGPEQLQGCYSAGLSSKYLLTVFVPSEPSREEALDHLAVQESDLQDSFAVSVLAGINILPASVLALLFRSILPSVISRRDTPTNAIPDCVLQIFLAQMYNFPKFYWSFVLKLCREAVMAARASVASGRNSVTPVSAPATATPKQNAARTHHRGTLLACILRGPYYCALTSTEADFSGEGCISGCDDVPIPSCGSPKFQNILKHGGFRREHQDVHFFRLSVFETYGFNRLDVDSETAQYPGANDRGAIPADTKNYVTFMEAVKSRLALPFSLQRMATKCALEGGMLMSFEQRRTVIVLVPPALRPSWDVETCRLGQCHKPADEPVHSLTFDYNFAAIPAANGPVYTRAGAVKYPRDASNVTDMPDYWDTVVKSPPERKRWLQERNLEERWWGSLKNWLSKTNTVEKDTTVSRNFHWADTFETSIDVSLTGQASARISSCHAAELAGSGISSRVSLLMRVHPVIRIARLIYPAPAADAKAHDQFTMKGEASVQYACREFTSGIGYTFSTVSFNFGKTDPDVTSNPVTPSDFTSGLALTAGYNAISIFASFHQFRLGLSVLGGAVIVAQDLSGLRRCRSVHGGTDQWFRLECHRRNSLNHPGSMLIMPRLQKFCIGAYYGVRVDTGLAGNVLYWETGPLALNFFANEQEVYGQEEVMINDRSNNEKRIEFIGALSLRSNLPPLALLISNRRTQLSHRDPASIIRIAG
ncbi:hypothetical protein C8R43DRAFT_959862 [Mycena crocata]|nr:hypothetical protein C8R43DRAFT_959862 [Mycena crocata]